MPITDSPTEQAIQAEHIATLYRLMPRSLPFYPLAGLLLTTTLWESAAHHELLLWFAALLLVTALRISQENNSLREKAERASAAKTRFLATASHDLRQPLHALGLFIETLAIQIRAPRTDALLQRIDEALASIGTMLTCATQYRPARALAAATVRTRSRFVLLGLYRARRYTGGNGRDRQ